ncbi:MAG: histidine--tRNA ligase [bacterium]
MNKEKFQTLKGFRDFLPENALKREWLKEKISATFKKWGYDPIETPTLEPLSLFENQIGEDEKLFYKFQDQGKRDVALRYDQTVPACRVAGQNPIPFKRYQIQPVFRAEKPQKGRYREFLQCDADIFGVNSPLADAEVIALSLDIYKDLGFTNAKVLINDRNLLKGIPYKALVSLDKINKIGKEAVLEELVKKGFGSKSKEYIEEVSNLKPNETIKTILNYLKSYGFNENQFSFDPTIIRSFSYSTGPIWEVIIPNFEGGSVLGGERYNELVKNICGKDISGTGFGLGFDRTLESLEQFKLVPNIKTSTKVLVTVFSDNLFEKSLVTAKYLRDNLINTELYPYENNRLDKQLKYADRKQIPYAIIIGPDEAEKEVITLKNLNTKEQKTATLKDIAAELSQR